VAPLPSTIQCAAGFRAGGLRVSGLPPLPHLSPGALKPAAISGRQSVAAQLGFSREQARPPRAARSLRPRCLYAV
jgi:hypothetical protein